VIPEKYIKEIQKWKKKPIYRDKIAGDGYPKTPITPEQYVLFRKEGEKSGVLFSTHYIRGAVSSGK
jgi:hypothetical protein